MKALMVFLIIISFVQASLLSFDIVIVALVIRSFLVSSLADQRENLWLAFGFGLLVSLLTAQSLGSISLIYLVSVLLVHIAKKSQVTTSWLAVLPLVAIGSFLIQITDGSFSMETLAYQFVSVIPLYLGLKLWEERFIIPGQIRLKL